MSDDEIYTAFADTLWQRNGTPIGLTHDKVNDALVEQYAPVFAAIHRFAEIAKYQDPNFDVRTEVTLISRESFSTTFFNYQNKRY